MFTVNTGLQQAADKMNCTKGQWSADNLLSAETVCQNSHNSELKELQ